MGGGSDEQPAAQQQPAATQQPVAQTLQMAQYPAYMPGQQNALSSQMANFYGPGDYAGMLGNNAQSATRPTLRNPTDIETYLNSLANAPQTAGAARTSALPGILAPGTAAGDGPLQPLANQYQNSNR